MLLLCSNNSGLCCVSIISIISVNSELVNRVYVSVSQVELSRSV